MSEFNINNCIADRYTAHHIAVDKNVLDVFKNQLCKIIATDSRNSRCMIGHNFCDLIRSWDGTEPVNIALVDDRISVTYNGCRFRHPNYRREDFPTIYEEIEKHGGHIVLQTK